MHIWRIWKFCWKTGFPLTLEKWERTVWKEDDFHYYKRLIFETFSTVLMCNFDWVVCTFPFHSQDRVGNRLTVHWLYRLWEPHQAGHPVGHWRALPGQYSECHADRGQHAHGYFCGPYLRHHSPFRSRLHSPRGWGGCTHGTGRCWHTRFTPWKQGRTILSWIKNAITVGSLKSPRSRDSISTRIEKKSRAWLPWFGPVYAKAVFPTMYGCSFYYIVQFKFPIFSNKKWLFSKRKLET